MPKGDARFSAIPEPSEDPNTLLITVRALKLAVEQLTGAAGNTNPVRNFVQSNAPTAVSPGDFWTKTIPVQTTTAGVTTQTQSSVLSFWNGQQWIVLATGA